MMLRKREAQRRDKFVSLSTGGFAEEPPSKTPALSASDKECLQRSIDRLRNAHKTYNPFGFLSSEGTQLLCASPSDVYERLTSLLSNIAIVSGLTLSAIAGSALSPLDPDEFADDKRMLVEAYNVTAALTVVIQLMVVLFSTYTLYVVIAAVHNPAAAYRTTMHMTRWIGLLEFLSYLPALGTVGLIILAAQLRCGKVAAWIVLGASIGMWVCIQGCFDFATSHARPYSAWQWSFVASAGFSWLGQTRDRARVESELLVEEAKKGVLGGLDNDSDFVIDTAAEPVEAETALAAWLQGVLTMTPTAGGLLAQRLFAAGLTHARMVEAAAYPGGFQALCDMLAANDMGLRPGDRLALASAAMREGGVST